MLLGSQVPLLLLKPRLPPEEEDAVKLLHIQDNVYIGLNRSAAKLLAKSDIDPESQVQQFSLGN